jgi:hypothetical protein
LAGVKLKLQNAQFPNLQELLTTKKNLPLFKEGKKKAN